MKTKLNKETSEFEVIVAAEKNEWQKIQKDVEKNLIENLSIKGFRKGKVPADVAKKHISRAQIMQQSVSKIIDSLAKISAGSIDKDIMVLSAPAYLVNKISDAELEVKFVYPVYPQFTIGNYKGIAVKFNQAKVDDKKVEDEINKIRSSQTMLKDKKGVIAKGDVAIFDFEGFVDEKPFDGGKAEKFQLEIGSGQFIPGFEDQMIGLKAKDEKDIKVQFPKNYQMDDLKGKDAVFKVKIHEVKTKELPKLDDAFVKSSGVPNVKTVAELKKYTKGVFEEQSRQEASSKFQREAFDLIIKETKNLVVPTVLISQEMKSIRERFEQNLKQQGMDIPQYLKMTNMKEEQFNSQFADQAKTRLTDAFIFGEIAKNEKIEISDNEYKEEYKKLAKVYGQTEEEVKKVVTKEQMQIPMINDKVIKFLIKNS